MVKIIIQFINYLFDVKNTVKFSVYDTKKIIILIDYEEQLKF